MQNHLLIRLQLAEVVGPFCGSRREKGCRERNEGNARKAVEAKFAFSLDAYLRGAKPIRFGNIFWPKGKSICLLAESL
jgi:hypothetical protein